MWSLGFSSFRHLMDLWDEAVEQDKRTEKIDSVIDANGLIMFFVKDGDVYGAPEESRMVFARMKNPDDEDPEEWADEASFQAFSMRDALEGREVSRLFQQKDFKGLKVISREKVVNLLSKKKAKKPVKKLDQMHGKDGAGIIQIKDRKK